MLPVMVLAPTVAAAALPATGAVEEVEVAQKLPSSSTVACITAAELNCRSVGNAAPHPPLFVHTVVNPMLFAAYSRR